MCSARLLTDSGGSQCNELLQTQCLVPSKRVVYTNYVHVIISAGKPHTNDVLRFYTACELLTAYQCLHKVSISIVIVRSWPKFGEQTNKWTKKWTNQYKQIVFSPAVLEVRHLKPGQGYNQSLSRTMFLFWRRWWKKLFLFFSRWRRLLAICVDGPLTQLWYLVAFFFSCLWPSCSPSLRDVYCIEPTSIILCKVLLTLKL